MPRNTLRLLLGWAALAVAFQYSNTLELQNTAFAQTPAAPVAPSQQDQDELRCLESTCRSVPLREKLTVVGQSYVRGVLGGFEQGTGINGGVQLTTNDKIPGLDLRANFLTSTKFARRADFEVFIPHAGSSRNHADAWFSYMRRVSNFFGIGSRIPKDFKSDFSLEQRAFQASFYRNLANHLDGGVYSQVVDSHSSRGKKDTNSPIDLNFSADPSVPSRRWAPGLFSFSKILSYGAYVLYDARDNSAGLTRGMQLYGRLASYDGLNNAEEPRTTAVFDDYGWNEAEYDARGYIPLGGPKMSLAVRSRGQFKRAKGGSQIPFYDLSWLGGREYVRGYETYRYRANNVLMFSTELRRTVYAKSDIRGVDAFLFADTGQVWGDARTPTSSAVFDVGFSSSNWHSGVGGGIQYRHSQDLAARIEAGHSNEGTLIYVSVSRGF